MDSDQESEDRKDSDESETGSSKSSEYSHSISSSLSGSSSDDYIQVDPKIIFNPILSGVASSKSQSNAKLSVTHHQDIRKQSLTRSQLKESSKTSTSSTSQVSDLTHECAFSTMSQSPSIQEWSTDSNESLFSIHTGGNGNFKRSRNRDNDAEVDKNEKNKKPREVTTFKQTLSITKGGEHKNRSLRQKENSDEATKRIVCFREEIKVGENRNHSTAIGCYDESICFRDSCCVVRSSDGNGTCYASPM
ncbi:unnamed protein product [Withania somnifera]